MQAEIVRVGASSPFSQEVFRRIRPGIPRERWPLDPMTVTFTAAASGLYLKADFGNDDFPAPYLEQARQTIMRAGVDLVVLSPFATLARGVTRAKRWRDSFLYMAVPLLFAIPLMGSLLDRLMPPTAALFGADLLALAFTQIQLSRRRAAIARARCVAEIPVPGMRLHVAAQK